MKKNVKKKICKIAMHVNINPCNLVYQRTRMKALNTQHKYYIMVFPSSSFHFSFNIFPDTVDLNYQYMYMHQQFTYAHFLLAFDSTCLLFHSYFMNFSVFRFIVTCHTFHYHHMNASKYNYDDYVKCKSLFKLFVLKGVAKK